MFPVILTEAEYFDPGTDVRYAFYQRVDNVTTVKHSHEFFELVLVLDGSIGHIVDEEFLTLGAGSLTLVRPGDTHYFQQIGRGSCQLINLAFAAAAVEALFLYLGSGFQPAHLVEASRPPSIVLSPIQRDHLRRRLEIINNLPYERQEWKRIAFRALLLEIIIWHFGEVDLPEPDWPAWLSELVVEMRNLPNFVAGLSTMHRLASVSPEHLARTFRRYLDKTPTEFVNELRLGHAANLLAHTDRPIIEVAAASGFESVSHFYRLFSRRFGDAPARFRATRHRSLISLD